MSPRGRRSSGARLLRRVAYLFRRVINYVIRRRRRRRFFLLFSSTFRPKGNCYQNTEYRLSLLVVRKFSRPDIFVERKLWHVENANRFSLREREAEHPVTSQCASRDRGEWDWVYYSSNKLLYLICRKVYGATDDTSSSWLNGKLFSFFFFLKRVSLLLVDSDLIVRLQPPLPLSLKLWMSRHDKSCWNNCAAHSLSAAWVEMSDFPRNCNTGWIGAVRDRDRF